MNKKSWCCCCFFFKIQALSDLYTSMKIMQPKCARNKHSCNLRSYVKILPLLTAREALRNHEYVLYWWFLWSLGFCYTFSFMNIQPTIKILLPTLQKAMDSGTVRIEKHSWNLIPLITSDGTQINTFKAHDHELTQSLQKSQWIVVYFLSLKWPQYFQNCKAFFLSHLWAKTEALRVKCTIELEWMC